MREYPVGGAHCKLLAGGGPGDGGYFFHAVLEGHDVACVSEFHSNLNKWKGECMGL